MVQIVFTLILWGVSLAAEGRVWLGQWVKKLFWGVVFLYFALDAMLVWQEYHLWGTNELSKFLLPSHQGTYFFSYSFYNIFAPHIIALAVALVLVYVTTKLNQKRNYVLFEKEEPYLAGLSLFLVGYPGWLLFLVLLIAVYLTWQLVVLIRRRNLNLRLPLYSLWPFLALVTAVVIETWLSNTDLWKLLKI